ncbi:hypothetical protein OQA88_6070 [Cercophora sp. LCS_1]
MATPNPALAAARHHFVTADHVQYLTDEEIEQFLDDLDHDGDGLIDYDEVEEKLDATYGELFPQQQEGNFLKKKWWLGSGDGNETSLTEVVSPETDLRHQFLKSIIGSDARQIPRAEFAARVKEWGIPSLELDHQHRTSEYVRKMSIWRRIRAYWAVHGPEVLFLTLVISMQVAFGVWQAVKYSINPEYVEAFGWGVVLAKTTAGALYPTMFFLVLSMSRYCSTFLRQCYCLSRFINWDLSQSFHIKMACVAMALSTLHAIGHLTGTFNNGSLASNDDVVDDVLGEYADEPDRTYVTYVHSLPGWTGLTSLGLFYVIGILSTPPVRRWNYEVFQMGHLLIYPLIGLLCAHGSNGLLQYPMLGFWLAFPAFMVLTERIVRMAVSFHRIPATLRILDNETVELTTTVPSERIWGYKAGQYLFLQVPCISFFQFHPFTISHRVDARIQLHIKTDGNWTRRLRALANNNTTGTAQIEIGVNGPFGAPAQRFYQFTHTIIVGSGIGVTPFSGILSDLQARDNAAHGGPSAVLDARSLYSTTDSNNSSLLHFPKESLLSRTRRRAAHLRKKSSLNKLSAPLSPSRFASDYRRVDFHWTVRQRNSLLWMADLLNDVSRSQQWHRRNDQSSHLDIRIHTHVTQRRKNIVTHVYSWLLEMYRTDKHPESPLTHLLNPTNLGRPDFVDILDRHYEDMVVYQTCKRMEREQRRSVATGQQRRSVWGEKRREDGEEVLRVGVFYCGVPVVGEVLADRCRILTGRGVEEGTRVEYHFMTEVF